MCLFLLIPTDSPSDGFCDPSLIGPDNALWLIYGWDQSDSSRELRVEQVQLCRTIFYLGQYDRD